MTMVNISVAVDYSTVFIMNLSNFGDQLFYFSVLFHSAADQS